MQMSDRKSIKTTIKQAIDYWSRIIDECDLSVDWAEADTHCWRCGCERHLQRCHIVPHSLGGEDSPKNIVLLCSRCHSEGPNVKDASVMWDWIKAYKVPFYGTFWDIMGQKEYEFIYKKSLIQEIKDIAKIANISDETVVFQRFNVLAQQTIGDASIHFGQPYFNNSTVAGIFRMILKRLANEYNVTNKLGITYKRDNLEKIVKKIIKDTKFE
jgi:Zn finger protein HypA/HybF involved in hydrogenase expression